MHRLYFCFIILLATISCKEKYESPVVSPATGYLVIEGVVNSGQGATTIRLSRTTPLENRTVQFEEKAKVTVEGEDKTVYPLIESGFGQYKANNLNLKNNVKYRLNIQTSNGKTYQSDFVAVKNNPPIDSINWVRNTVQGTPLGEGVQMYINTHDPQNKTRYYQWAFEETWEIHADFQTFITYEVKTAANGIKTYTAIWRDPTDPQYFDSTQYYCWKTAPSTDILIGTTAKLKDDVVNLPLGFIPKGSIKLNVLYSILVKQYSLTPEGYAFLEIMKKNTEQTGSIFDAQPSGVSGNIHNVADVTEPVIGYLTICPIQEKRIFIKTQDVPDWGYFSNCKEMTFINSSNIIRDQAFNYIPTNVVPHVAPFPAIPSFYAAPPECVDCRLSGSNTKPSFWP